MPRITKAELEVEIKDLKDEIATLKTTIESQKKVLGLHQKELAEVRQHHRMMLESFYTILGARANANPTNPSR